MDNLDETEAFYRSILGLTVIAKESGHHVFFQAGEASVLLAFVAKAAMKGDHLPSHGARAQGILLSVSTPTHWTLGGESCKKTASPLKRKSNGPGVASRSSVVMQQGI